MEFTLLSTFRYNCRPSQKYSRKNQRTFNQYVWAREEKNLGIAKLRSQRETKENESQRCLDSLSDTQPIREVKARSTLTVEVKRSPIHEARLAKLTIRFATFEIQVPSNRRKASLCQPVKLQVILVEEENPNSVVNPSS